MTTMRRNNNNNNIEKGNNNNGSSILYKIIRLVGWVAQLDYYCTALPLY